MTIKLTGPPVGLRRDPALAGGLVTEVHAPSWWNVPGLSCGAATERLLDVAGDRAKITHERSSLSGKRDASRRDEITRNRALPFPVGNVAVLCLVQSAEPPAFTFGPTGRQAPPRRCETASSVIHTAWARKL